MAPGSYNLVAQFPPPRAQRGLARHPARRGPGQQAGDRARGTAMSHRVLPSQRCSQARVVWPDQQAGRARGTAVSHCVLRTPAWVAGVRDAKGLQGSLTGVRGLSAKTEGHALNLLFSPGRKTTCIAWLVWGVQQGFGHSFAGVTLHATMEPCSC